MTRRIRTSVSGHYAGPLTRAVAAILDGFFIVGLYTLGYAGLSLLVNALTSWSLNGDYATPLGILALASWAFFYTFASLAVTGRTAGKALAGLRVVTSDG